MKDFLTAVLIGIGIAACMLVTVLIGKERGYGQGYAAALNEPHKADTVWKVDTNFVDRPVEIIKWKDREKLVYIPVTDTLAIHDTTFLALPREYKQYGDETYQAQVSGVDPSLDWIRVNQKTAYITNTVVEKKRWGFGVTAGPGVLWDGSFHGGVGIVAGLQYTF